MANALSVSIVMPAYNEEHSIERVILDHVAVVKELGPQIAECEIVCVDDGSTDGTAQILARLASGVPVLKVIRHAVNRGIAESFMDGYRGARGKYIYSTGSDGQWPAENLKALVARALAGADLVIGVRRNRRQIYTLRRRFISAAFNTLPRILFGVDVLDAGSVKLGIRQAFEFKLISRSPFFEAERILLAYRARLRIEFVPIEFKPRGTGKAHGASLKNLASSVRDLLKCVRVYGLGNRMPSAARLSTDPRQNAPKPESVQDQGR